MKKIRLGTTSFIYRDSRVKNVKILKDQVDVIQLLFLAKQYLDEDIKEIEELARVKGSDLEYGVHLPLDFNFRDDIELIKKSVEEISVLDTSFFILHPENKSSFYKIIEELGEFYPIAVENIDDISFFDKIYHLNCKICFDVGHAIVHNVDIINFVKKFGDKISVFHIHGVSGCKDHCSVRFLDERLLSYLLDFASERGIYSVIEVFEEDKFIDSMEYLKGVFRKYGYSCYRWS